MYNFQLACNQLLNYDEMDQKQINVANIIQFDGEKQKGETLNS